MNLVYTAIYGGYDKLLQPTQVTDGWDYICYSDIEFNGGVWGVRKWDLGLDPVRSSKWIKIKHPMLNNNKVRATVKEAKYVHKNF